MGTRIVGGLVRNQLLPRTRQVLTAPTAEYATGDDGYFQAGLPLVTRFVDSGHGTIYDRAMGLTWVKQPELIIPGSHGNLIRAGSLIATNQIVRAGNSVHTAWTDSEEWLAGDLCSHGGLYYVCILTHTGAGDASTQPDVDAVHWIETIWTGSAADLTTPATMAWTAAVAESLGTGHGGKLDYAGFTDWRLPNILELASLVDWSAQNGHNLTFFPNGIANTYWSSTTRAGVTTSAHYVSFANASGIVTAVGKATTYYVRPVRGGHCIQ